MNLTELSFILGNVTQQEDPRILATSYLMYKIGKFGFKMELFLVLNFYKFQNLHSGDALNQFYFPVLVPVGIVGNILSFLVRYYNSLILCWALTDIIFSMVSLVRWIFYKHTILCYISFFGDLSCNSSSLFHLQVMIQSHNRHMSFSLYICALAIADTAALLNGKYNVTFSS